MKNITLLILFLIVTFILNVMFYYSSSNYRDFLSGLKYENQVDFSGVVEKNNKLKKEVNEIGSGILDKKDILKEVEIKKGDEDIKDDKKEIRLGKSYKNILDLFSDYNLEPLQINTSLFDITNEYPDKYFEYYSRNITIYFFPNKDYEDLFDIFNVLSSELPFSINKANNFGNKSFYINLNSDIDDFTVRLIVDYNNIVFGIKVRRSDYPEIKKILKNFKN